MGIFDKWAGKKPAASPIGPVSAEDGLLPTDPQPIQGPPEFVRVAEMQRAYWTHNAEEQARLEARGVEQLGWRDVLRLHHLICLQRLTRGAEREAATEKCRRTVRRLLAADGPYRPRPAMVWQGQATQPGTSREPDMQGQFLNPSLTHLGCLEVYRVDATNSPTRLDFVSFDELTDVVFAPAKLIRAARLFYEDGRDEIVFVPLLYGLTWALGDEYDRDGRMTRFIAHLNDDELAGLGASGVGVGQQDLFVRSREGGGSLFGLGSVAEISFPLDVSDPRFDDKARARGIDPDEARRRVGGG